MPERESITINEGLEMRESKTGKLRCSVKVTAEPLQHIFDPKELGKGPADAIAALLKRKLADIAAAAAPATLRARKVAAKAVALGKPWAMKRYAGGRIGTKAPNQSMSLFDDSGRMRESIAVNASKDNAWRVNVAGNRLDPATADRGGSVAVVEIWRRLVELVPELGDARLLVADFSVRRAIEESAKSIIHKQAARSAGTSIKTLLSTAQQTLDVFNQAASLFGA